MLVDVYDRVGAQVQMSMDDAIAGATDAVDALDRLIAGYCRIAFAAADLVVVVMQNRGALPAAERPRLRRRGRRIMDVWRAVVAEARPDLRPTEVATLATGILPFMNFYALRQLLGLPDPNQITPLVRAFVLPPPPAV